MGERRGRVKLRNLYKGHMEKDDRECESNCMCGVWVSRAGENNVGEMGTTAIEQR